MNAYEQIRDTLVVVRDALLTIAAHEDDKEFVRTWLALTKDEVNKALSAPTRNCDVGTAEEQGERHKAYCRKHFTPDQLGGNCHKCPLKDKRGWSCQLAWAQMPYEEEGGAK